MRKLSSSELGLQAFEAVKRMILTQELAPGAKIVQERLAAELGISRTPLRSGLQMLEAEYLVESIPRRGVFVKTFTDQEIIDVFDCRIALECQAVYLYTKRATNQMVEQLATLFQPFQTSANIDLKKYQETDIQFHNGIIKGCGNIFLQRLFRQGNLLTLIGRIGLIRPPEQTLPEHFDIIQAIKDRQSDRASRILRDHLQRSQKLLLKRLK